jgi:hypothetical protein
MGACYNPDSLKHCLLRKSLGPRDREKRRTERKEHYWVLFTKSEVAWYSMLSGGLCSRTRIILVLGGLIYNLCGCSIAYLTELAWFHPHFLGPEHLFSLSSIWRCYSKQKYKALHIITDYFASPSAGFGGGGFWMRLLMIL